MRTLTPIRLILGCLIAVYLFVVQTPLMAGDVSESKEIIGTTWEWQQTRYNNDQNAVPTDPTKYTVTSNTDGTINIRADCNRGGGTYSIQNQQITIEVTHTTRAMCPPDSLDQEFIKNLNATKIYFFKDANLYFDLKYDTGTMVLVK